LGEGPQLTRPYSKLKYLRQSATLTTFRNPVFDKPIENIAAVYAIFKRTFGTKNSLQLTSQTGILHPETEPLQRKYDL
jgi:hypothetical protein